MDSFTASVTMKALDGLSMRSIVTAQNIANAGTANYRPLRVTFEDALKEAAQRGPETVRALQPQVETAPASNGSTELRLDMELATASSTAMRYAALIELLGRQMQVDALAVSGSR